MFLVFVNVKLIFFLNFDTYLSFQILKVNEGNWYLRLMFEMFVQ